MQTEKTTEIITQLLVETMEKIKIKCPNLEWMIGADFEKGTVFVKLKK